MGTERQVGDRQGHLGQGPGAQGQQALRGQGGMWVSGGVWEEEGRMAKSTPALEGRKEGSAHCRGFSSKVSAQTESSKSINSKMPSREGRVRESGPMRGSKQAQDTHPHSPGPL